jgi:ubiquinone/menaquinone biosynthesis C-methylase UbiE
MTIKEKYLFCIDCRGNLCKKDNFLVCQKCGRKYGYQDGILNCIGEMEEEKVFSQKKWDIFYKNWQSKNGVIEEYKKSLPMFQKYGVEQILKYYKVDKETVYFELGCGTFTIGSLLAKKCKLVIGIDFSLTALKIAKKIMDNKGIKNYLLIRGDIFKIPLRDKTINLLYGGGVIEHFKDTGACIKEFGRIMKKGGIALNAVPYLNIGSLTYRQVWGNIPDFPVIKQLAEFIHLKLLRGKHMYFGYELSFTKLKLKKLHQKFGFRSIKFVRLESEIMLGFLPKVVRPAARYLARNCSWFWPMMLVVAQK